MGTARMGAPCCRQQERSSGLLVHTTPQGMRGHLENFIRRYQPTRLAGIDIRKPKEKRETEKNECFKGTGADAFYLEG